MVNDYQEQGELGGEDTQWAPVQYYHFIANEWLTDYRKISAVAYGLKGPSIEPTHAR